MSINDELVSFLSKNSLLPSSRLARFRRGHNFLLRSCISLGYIVSIQLDIDLIFQFQCLFKYLLSIGKTEEAGNNRSWRSWLLCFDSMQALKLDVAGIFHFKLSFHKTINKFLSVVLRRVGRIRNVKETPPSSSKLTWLDFRFELKKNVSLFSD